MLEKILGIEDVAKLRIILLLEANFNRLNKIILNNRVLPKLEQFKAIPTEVIGGRRG